MELVRRDPFGVRPLYFAETPAGVVWSQSIWDLLERSGVPRALEPSAVAAFLCGVLGSEASLFRGIRRVPPGHALSVEDGRPRLRRHWMAPEPASAAVINLTREQAGAELLRRLRASVGQWRLPSACAQSGGLDSGVLLALMAEVAPRPLAVTQADDFTDGDELAGAHRLAEHCGAALEVLTIREEDLPDHLEATVLACQEPIWNGRAVARHLFFRAARRAGVTALLSGVGADETLWGNPPALLDLPERAEAERAIAETVLTPEARGSLPAERSNTERIPEEVLARSRQVVLSHVLPDSTLPPECRTASAEGIAVHLPYLSDAVAAFALGLPLSWQIAGVTGKRLLREAARGLVPEEIRRAPKRPRLAPSGGRGTRARARWHDLYAAWLTKARLAPLEVIDPGRVRRLLGRHRIAPASDDEGRDALLLRLVSMAILRGLDRNGRITPAGPEPNAHLTDA